MEFVTLRTITNDLRKISRSSNIAADENLSLRQLEDWVHQYRALLLKRDLDKGKKPNPDYIQEINHLRLEPVEAVGDNIVNGRDKSGMYCYRTILPIPKTIDLNFTSGFMYIGTPIGEEIQFVPESRVRWQEFKKYTKKDRLSYLKNEHLYVVNDFPLEFITTRAVFEIPPEVGRFINPLTNQPYYDMDTKYPIPINMISELKTMILQRELNIESNSPSDTTNDERDNPTYGDNPPKLFNISR